MTINHKTIHHKTIRHMTVHHMTIQHTTLHHITIHHRTMDYITMHNTTVTWWFGSLGCKTHCHGCMNVAWGLFFRGGSRSTKLFVFSGQVAAAGDERQLVCMAGPRWARRSSQCNGCFDAFCVFLRVAATW